MNCDSSAGLGPKSCKCLAKLGGGQVSALKWVVGLLACLAMPLQAESFSFDLSDYRKKPFEWGGHLEFAAERLGANPGSSAQRLVYPGATSPDPLKRYHARVEGWGKYRFDGATLHWLGHAGLDDLETGSQREAGTYELYMATQPFDRGNIEIGKRALRWGKGYAWNPVGFVERVKDPTDPELAREGFTLASFEYLRRFEGPLQALAFTQVLVPVNDRLNSDFTVSGGINPAARLYLLYGDTDIDLMVLGDGARLSRVGADFSRNLASNLEVHGEIAYALDQKRVEIDSRNQLRDSYGDTLSGLIGLRYLSESELTWIVEYYRNGNGYEASQWARFHDLARSDPVASASLFATARRARQAGFGSANSGRDYLYLKVSAREPFDTLYLNAGVSGILNLDDQSYSLMPELVYTGFGNSELRLRVALMEGGTSTEYGEKLTDRRLELRWRYFF